MIRFRLALFAALLLSTFNQVHAQDIQAKKTPIKSNTSANKLIEFIVGKWTLSAVNDGQKDVSSQQSSKATMQWIQFNEEGRYLSGDNNTNGDAGSYRLNEEHSILYLQSEGNNTPKEWNISFKPNQLIITPRNDKEENKLTYHYTRTGGGTLRH